jgi:hypothetical protein
VDESKEESEVKSIGNADWGLRFVVTPLFPTGSKPAIHQASYAN